jgi:hypothetical protein
MRIQIIKISNWAHRNLCHQHLPVPLSFFYQVPMSKVGRNRNDAETAKTHSCPFNGCTEKYTSLSKVKHHLRSLRGGNAYNAAHKADDPLWTELDEQEFLKPHSRPGNLSHAEIKMRRMATQVRHYTQNKEKIRKKQQERREKLNASLAAAGELSHVIKTAQNTQSSLLTTVQSHHNTLQNLYGDSGKYNLPSFLHDEDKDNINTDGENAEMNGQDYDDVIPPISSYRSSFTAFARIIVYYLSSESLPDITSLDYGVTTFGEVLPNATHQKRAISLIHPDKSTGDAEIAALFNSSWDLWKQYVNNSELMNQPLPRDDPDDAAAFEERGDDFKCISDMFWAYYGAANRSVSTLSPTSLSLHGLHNALVTAEEADKLLMSSDGLVRNPEVGNLLETVEKYDSTRKSKRKHIEVVESETEEIEEVTRRAEPHWDDDDAPYIGNDNIDPSLVGSRSTRSSAAAAATRLPQFE